MHEQEQQEIVIDFAEEAEKAQVATLMSVSNTVASISALLDRKGFLTCEECGDDIPKDRREAYPAARTCVPCQSWLERTYAK